MAKKEECYIIKRKKRKIKKKALPKVIYIEIFLFLDKEHLNNIRIVSKYICHIIDGYILWNLKSNGKRFRKFIGMSESYSGIPTVQKLKKRTDYFRVINIQKCPIWKFLSNIMEQCSKLGYYGYIMRSTSNTIYDATEFIYNNKLKKKGCFEATFYDSTIKKIMDKHKQCIEMNLEKFFNEIKMNKHMIKDINNVLKKKGYDSRVNCSYNKIDVYIHWG
jgi:hypothetical protein